MLEGRISLLEGRLDAFALEYRRAALATRERQKDDFGISAMLRGVGDWFSGAPSSAVITKRRRSYIPGLPPASLARVPEEEENYRDDDKKVRSRSLTSLITSPIRGALLLLFSIVQSFMRVFSSS